MRTFDIDILILPGWTNAGADHWQTRWQARLKTSRRVEQADWQRPELGAWTGQLLACIAAAEKPVVLVAHALGVATVVHAAPKIAAMQTRGQPEGQHRGQPRDRLPHPVLGAFLVAPDSGAAIAANARIDSAFSPYPRDPLPFPSLLVASRNDPYCPFDEAGEMALDWGSTLVDAGETGHIDTASGHGPWPEGAMRFGWFLKQLGKTAAEG